MQERYKVIRLLGKGGMGKVYLASDRERGHEVALKVLAVSRGEISHALARFQREARAQASVENPHVVGIYDFSFESDPPFLSMEYVEGQDLASLLSWHGALPLDQVLRIARDVAEGLDCLHQHGVLHRDLKPANLMVRKQDGSAVLMDLGLARIEDATALTATGQVVGTPMYLPPETLRDKGWQPASDLYQLGAILFELLVGKTLLPGSSMEELVSALVVGDQRPFPADSQVPEGVRRAILRAVALEPEERFSSGAELVAALVAGTKAPEPGEEPVARPLDAASVKERDPSERAPTLADRASRGSAPGGRRPFLLVAVGLAGILLGALALRRSQPEEVRWSVVGDVLQVRFRPGSARDLRLEVGDRVVREVSPGPESAVATILFRGLSEREEVPARLVWGSGAGPVVSVKAQEAAIAPRFTLGKGRTLQLEVRRPVRIGSPVEARIEVAPGPFEMMLPEDGGDSPRLAWEEQGIEFTRSFPWEEIFRRLRHEVEELPTEEEHREWVSRILAVPARSPLERARGRWSELSPWLPQLFASPELRVLRGEVWKVWQVFQLYDLYDSMERRWPRRLGLPEGAPGSRSDRLPEGLGEDDGVTLFMDRYKGNLSLAPLAGVQRINMHRFAAVHQVAFPWPEGFTGSRLLVLGMKVLEWRNEMALRVRAQDHPEGFQLLLWHPHGMRQGLRYQGWSTVLFPADLQWAPGTPMVAEVLPREETDERHSELVDLRLFSLPGSGEAP